MRSRMLIATGAVAGVMCLTAGSAMAAPPEPAGDAFVCPVLTLSQEGVDKSGKFASIDGDGSPTGGDHSSPADMDYTAIWSGN